MIFIIWLNENEKNIVLFLNSQISKIFMKKVFFSGVIILSFFFLKSQPSQILYCKGNIPSEILSLATFKYSSDVGKIGKGKNKKTKKIFICKVILA